MAREVFPLDQRTREDFPDRRHELVHQRVVRFTAQPRVRHPEVERVGEQGLVIGPDVQIDREAERRVEPRPGGVERELSYRDPHAAHALVTDSEDRLVVRDDDDPDVAAGRVSK